MIRINLLRQQPGVVTNRQKTKPQVSVGGIFSLLGITVVCLGIIGAGYWVITHRSFYTGIIDKITSYWSPPVKQEPSVSVRDDYSPTSVVGARAVEEVVRDDSERKDKLKKNGILDIPYSQLSFIEKVNYEIRFSKNVCELLNKTAVPGVDFNTISFGDFTVIRGQGVATSKESVVQYFSQLKNEDVKMMPKPQSQIIATDEGYTFSIACSTAFGLDLESSFLLSYDDIMEFQDLPITLKKVMETAEKSGLHFSEQPVQTDAFPVGDCRRYRYHFSARGSYQDFVAFVQNLFSRKIPCAIEKSFLKAVNSSTLDIQADMLFTTSGT